VRHRCGDRGLEALAHRAPADPSTRRDLRAQVRERCAGTPCGSATASASQAEAIAAAAPPWYACAVIGTFRVRFAVVLIGSLAVLGCAGDRCGSEMGVASSTCSVPPPGPAVARSWALNAVMYTGASCTGTMSLSGPDLALSGSLMLNSPCLTDINGVVDAAAYGWDGTRGTFAGVLSSMTDGYPARSGERRICSRLHFVHH
jgi:hypothetical protein